MNHVCEFSSTLKTRSHKIQDKTQMSTNVHKIKCNSLCTLNSNTKLKLGKVVKTNELEQTKHKINRLKYKDYNICKKQHQFTISDTIYSANQETCKQHSPSSSLIPWQLGTV